MRRIILALLFTIHCSLFTFSQELQVKVNINHSQITGTDNSVFDNLQQTLEQFINERQWTDLQFQENERIQCNLNITVSKFNRDENKFECTALIQANRPVYNASYTTTLYNNRDASFHFEYAQFDQLNYNDETVDNQLTALVAYYAYLIIGLDLDSFSPLGGTDILQRCMQLVNNAQDGRADETLPSAAVRLLPQGSRRDGHQCGARTYGNIHRPRGAVEESPREQAPESVATDMDGLQERRTGEHLQRQGHPEGEAGRV